MTESFYQNDAKSPADLERMLRAVLNPSRILRKQVLSTPCGRRVARTIPVSGIDDADRETRERFSALARWQGCIDHGHLDLRLPYTESA